MIWLGAIDERVDHMICDLKFIYYKCRKPTRIHDLQKVVIDIDNLQQEGKKVKESP